MRVKSNKLFIILMISSYLFAYSQGGSLPYRIFYGFLFIFLFALLSLYKHNKNLKVKVMCNKESYSSGDLDEFAIVINNLGLLPTPNIVVKSKAISEINSKYNGDAVIIMGDDDKTVKNMVEFKHRGIYDFGHIIIESSDLFQVFKRTKVIYDKKITKVYPKIYDIENIFLRSKDVFKNAQSKKSRIEDMYSICDVRKYREGDNLKRIHWKLSAKCGELFVRNFDTVSGEESNIFLNMNIENMTLETNGIIEENMVDFCVSLVNYMELRGIKSKVFINSALSREFGIKNREDVNALMEFFLKQKSDGTENFAKFINSNLNRITKLSWIAIIVGIVDENFKNNLIMMKDFGYNIFVFYEFESSDGIEQVNILKKIGIDCFKIGAILNKSRE
jgi:hypothetical protein